MATRESTGSLLRIVLAVLAVIVLVPILMMLFAMPMMGVWGGMPGRGVAPVWGIGIDLAWLLVLLGVVYLLYRALSGGATRGQDPAIEELRAAYARGDISDEEFDRRRERLERDRE